VTFRAGASLPLHKSTRRVATGQGGGARRFT
jgi:hypothetical protein